MTDQNSRPDEDARRARPEGSMRPVRPPEGVGFALVVALLALVIAAAAMLSGCATGGAAQAGASAANPAAARGKMLAERACSGCHAVGEAGASNWRGAPAFRDLRLSFVTISRERRLAELTRTHVGMPPMEVSLDDVQDILTYIETLRPAPR